MKKSMKTPLFVSLFFSFAVAGTQAQAGGAGAPPNLVTKPVTVQAGPTISSSVQPLGKQGKFIVKYEGSKIPGMDAVRRQLAKDDVVQMLLNAVALDLPIPQDIPVNFKDCGVENAFWNPDDKTVTYCYELIESYNKGYKNVASQNMPILKGMTQEDILYGTTIFVLFHELGHGLISLYNLPATGREEDAVDQLSTTTIFNLDQLVPKNAGLDMRPSRYALLGAYYFYHDAISVDAMGAANKEIDVSRSIFADEHALGQQRFYDIMCMTLGYNKALYGPMLAAGFLKAEEIADKNPDAYKGEGQAQALLAKYDNLNILPGARAVRCEMEYKKYSHAWKTLINDYARNAKVPAAAPVVPALPPKGN